MKTSPFDFSLSDWKTYTLKEGYKDYTAQQVYSWIYKENIYDPALFSNVSLTLRQKLSEDFDWSLPKINQCLISQDETRKFLIEFKDESIVESVLMFYPNRTTLCISSQVGCRLACTFCQTGKMGLKRHLTQGEILSQVLCAQNYLNEQKIPRKVSHIVFMGMGEPLDNFYSCIEACRILLHPHCFNLSKKHVTLSSSGLAPEIASLSEDVPASLAISLHSAIDLKRSQLMPINRKYPLSVLKEALKTYCHNHPGRFITFEYIMIHKVNDGLDDMKALADYLKDIPSKINLIPMNFHPGSRFLPSPPEFLSRFQQFLKNKGYIATVRYSRGQDISAACGQLALNSLITPSPMVSTTFQDSAF